MADYKKMYDTLFNKITDIINELEQLQQLTEEMYIGSDEHAIDLHISENKKES